MSKDIFEIINPTNTLGVCRPLAHILGACETIVYNALLIIYNPIGTSSALNTLHRHQCRASCGKGLALELYANVTTPLVSLFPLGITVAV